MFLPAKRFRLDFEFLDCLPADLRSLVELEPAIELVFELLAGLPKLKMFKGSKFHFRKNPVEHLLRTSKSESRSVKFVVCEVEVVVKGLATGRGLACACEW